MLGIPWETLQAKILSIRLNTGPGAGEAVQAADAWREISDIFQEAAQELGSAIGLLNENWEGIGALASTAKMASFVNWLSETAELATNDSSKAIVQATANTVARMEMPSLAEITAVEEEEKGMTVVISSSLITMPLGVVVAAAAAPLLAGEMAALEIKKQSINTRAALSMANYEAASIATIVVPTNYTTAPPMANGLALSPIEDLQLMADKVIAAAKGTDTDKQRDKSQDKTTVTDESKDHIATEGSKAEAEGLMNSQTRGLLGQGAQTAQESGASSRSSSSTADQAAGMNRKVVNASDKLLKNQSTLRSVKSVDKAAADEANATIFLGKNQASLNTKISFQGISGMGGSGLNNSELSGKLFEQNVSDTSSKSGISGPALKHSVHNVSTNSGAKNSRMIDPLDPLSKSAIPGGMPTSGMGSGVSMGGLGGVSSAAPINIGAKSTSGLGTMVVGPNSTSRRSNELEDLTNLDSIKDPEERFIEKTSETFKVKGFVAPPVIGGSRAD